MHPTPRMTLRIIHEVKYGKPFLRRDVTSMREISSSDPAVAGAAPRGTVRETLRRGKERARVTGQRVVRSENERREDDRRADALLPRLASDGQREVAPRPRSTRVALLDDLDVETGVAREGGRVAG